nr:hypothetical protein CFP56_11267 [Quercus suber]
MRKLDQLSTYAIQYRRVNGGASYERILLPGCCTASRIRFDGPYRSPPELYSYLAIAKDNDWSSQYTPKYRHKVLATLWQVSEYCNGDRSIMDTHAVVVPDGVVIARLDVYNPLEE